MILARDEGLRETIATIVGELSPFLVSTVSSVDEARRAMRFPAASVLIAAPGWADGDVDALLTDLVVDGAGVVIVSPSTEDQIDGAAFVRAPFDVDTLLDALESTAFERTSRKLPIRS